MWVELVVGSHSCSEGFFWGVLQFSILHKKEHFKFQVNLATADE